MQTTRLSSKGQIIIPKSVRKAHQWPIGQEFFIEETADGLLLKPKAIFPPSTIEDVAGCLKYAGPAKSIEDMNDAVGKGIREQWHDRD
jgi:AbrB family looped-hinge helix DNA binding protein